MEYEYILDNNKHGDDMKMSNGKFLEGHTIYHYKDFIKLIKINGERLDNISEMENAINEFDKNKILKLHNSGIRMNYTCMIFINKDSVTYICPMFAFNNVSRKKLELFKYLVEISAIRDTNSDMLNVITNYYAMNRDIHEILFSILFKKISDEDILNFRTNSNETIFDVLLRFRVMETGISKFDTEYNNTIYELALFNLLKKYNFPLSDNSYRILINPHRTVEFIKLIIDNTKYDLNKLECKIHPIFELLWNISRISYLTKSNKLTRMGINLCDIIKYLIKTNQFDLDRRTNSNLRSSCLYFPERKKNKTVDDYCNLKLNEFMTELNYEGTEIFNSYLDATSI